MDKQEMMKIASAMRTYYPKETLLPTKETISLWYEELKDIPYEVCANALRKHVQTSVYPPTIADIRRNATELTTVKEDWGKGWELTLKAIRTYGQYRQEEALDSLPPVTRMTVERLGYRSLCMSEEYMTDRANFRMVFNELNERNTETSKLTPQLQAIIGGLLNGTNQRGERGLLTEDARAEQKNP